MALARTLIQTQPSPPGEQELIQASTAIQALTLDGFALHRLSADLLLSAIEQVESQKIQANGSAQLLGRAFQLNALREGAERELRSCARYAKSPQERIALVDHANRIRPLTLM
jgi:serine/threonine-protein kinase PknG